MGRTRLLQDLASRIDLVKPGHPVRAAIDGVDAAGKTILADELAEHLTALGRSVIRASIDGFHLPAPVRHRLGSLSPEGYYLDSFAYDSLIDKLLQPLGPGGDGRYQTSSSQSEIGHHVAEGGMVNSRPSSMNLNSASQLSKMI